MRISGSIPRTERKISRSLIGRSVVSRSVSRREFTPLFAFPDGTAQPGPDVHLSGPGYFFPVGPPKAFCTIPKSVLRQRTFTSYFTPLEKKSRLGATRSNSHGQGPAL